MLATLLPPIATVLLASAAVTSADLIDYEFAQWQHRSDDSDLFTFVTVCAFTITSHPHTELRSQRPDLKPPKLNVALNKKEWTAPGYLFVAPYDCLECSHVPTTSHTTHQIGPHIYTQEGVSRKTLWQN